MHNPAFNYFYQADVVVFHLPGLQQEMEHDLHKLKDQIWIAWYMESEKDCPDVKFPEIKEMFDFWICHWQDTDAETQKEHPLVGLCRKVPVFFYSAIFPAKQNNTSKGKNI